MTDTVKNELTGWLREDRSCGAGAIVQAARSAVPFDAEPLEQFLVWKREGRDCLLFTVVAAPAELALPAGARIATSGDGRMIGTLGGCGLETWIDERRGDLLRGKARCVPLVRDEAGWWHEEAGEDSLALLVEPHPAPLDVVIFGAGSVAEKLGHLLRVLEIPFRVCDDRLDASLPTRFPAARETITAPYQEALVRLSLGISSHCVVMTAGHRHDAEVAAALLARPEIPYVGVMHNPAKAIELGKAIRELGSVPDGRFHCPIGLSIARQASAEIALAVAAEIVCQARSGTPSHARLDWEALAQKSV